jgi:hypothetical protein
MSQLFHPSWLYQPHGVSWRVQTIINRIVLIVTQSWDLLCPTMKLCTFILWISI